MRKGVKKTSEIQRLSTLKTKNDCIRFDQTTLRNYFSMILFYELERYRGILHSTKLFAQVLLNSASFCSRKNLKFKKKIHRFSVVTKEQIILVSHIDTITSNTDKITWEKIFLRGLLTPFYRKRSEALHIQTPFYYLFVQRTRGSQGIHDKRRCYKSMPTTQFICQSNRSVPMPKPKEALGRRDLLHHFAQKIHNMQHLLTATRRENLMF